MRIVHICFSRLPGGIEQAFMTMDAALRAQGHAVITVIEPGSWLESRLSPSAVTKIRNRFGNADLPAMLALRTVIRQQEAEVILVHGKRAIYLVQWIKGKAKLAVVQHRFLFAHLPKADAVFCVSRTMRNEAIAHGLPPTRIAYLPNILSAPVETRNRPHHSPPVIGFLGRLVPEKGLFTFLEALSLLKSRQIPFTVQLGGEGPLKERLETETAKRGLKDIVHFTGWTEQPAAFLQQADIFCLPSHSESFGLVILEAAATGCPVVATRSKGPTELIQHGETGLLVEAGNAAALADALSTLLHDAEYGRRLAYAAAQTLNQFSPETVGKTLSRLLDQLVRGKELS